MFRSIRTLCSLLLQASVNYSMLLDFLIASPSLLSVLNADSLLPLLPASHYRFSFHAFLSLCFSFLSIKFHLKLPQCKSEINKIKTTTALTRQHNFQHSKSRTNSHSLRRKPKINEPQSEYCTSRKPRNVGEEDKSASQPAPSR